MRRLGVWLIAAALAAAGCKEPGTITIRSIDFVGVQGVSTSRLKNALATRESARFPWGRQYTFDRSRLDEDLKRIEAFYTDRGYPNARVTNVQVTPNEDKDAVSVTITVVEGAPVTVSSLELSGFEVIPPDRVEAIRERFPIRQGQPWDRQQVNTARDLAAGELHDQGYPYAKVSVAEKPDATSVALTLVAEPGPLAHFGPIEMVGNQTVENRIILRQLTFKTGDLYRRSLVQDSQRRLYGLQLFQFVNIENLEPDRQDPDVRMRVTVAEGKHQRVNLGVGYGTEEKGRVDASYHHVNFLGGGRTAGVRGRWSSLDRGIRLEFNQPYLFGPHVSMIGEGQHWLTFTPAYESTITGGRVMVTHQGSQRMSWAVSFINERDNSTIAENVRDDPALRDDLIALGLDPETGHQDGTVNAIALDLQRSTATNLLNARSGYQIAGHLELAGDLLPGQYHYRALTADARHYLPVSERVTLANRAQAGTINPFDNDPGNVPFSKKYFLGGATSLRGWGRFEVSPVGTSGLPVGGNTMFAFSSEVRASIIGRAGAVAFLDAGNVWEHGWTIDLSDLRYAVGLGFRYETGIGPVRFDVGQQLNPIDGLLIDGEPQTRYWRFHFSIGQAF
jgi:outer membrane protein assembly complex protein YaeT